MATFHFWQILYHARFCIPRFVTGLYVEFSFFYTDIIYVIPLVASYDARVAKGGVTAFS